MLIIRLMTLMLWRQLPSTAEDAVRTSLPTTQCINAALCNCRLCVASTLQDNGWHCMALLCIALHWMALSIYVASIAGHMSSLPYRLSYRKIVYLTLRIFVRA